MNKTELIEVLAEKTGATKLLTEKVINAYLETVMDTVAKGENVSVVGFGAFSKAHRNARTGRNPSNGQAIQLPATDLPKFVPGKIFKDKVKAQ